MKRIILTILVLVVTILACKNETNVPKTSQNLKAMTYNIRLDAASDGENVWANRKEFLSAQILFHAPDILGIQEALPNQMNDLKNALIDYKFIGVGRDGDDKGEYSAIFYNSNKLKVEQENTFWLSNTPNQVSKGWDAAYARVCTYGLFTDLNSNSQIWVFNTHLDHVGKQARLNGMQLILKKISEVNSSNIPVIIMGDFNVEPNSLLISNLKEVMNDAKTVSKITFGSNGTFNGFNYKAPVTRRIDYIMVSKAHTIKVKKYGVLSSAVDFKYPSDHFPVLVELMLN